MHSPYEVYKSRGELALGSNITVTAVGFVFSFIFGWIVVKTFLRYVQRHSFARFLPGGAFWWAASASSRCILFKS